MGNFVQGSLSFANIVLALFVIFFAVSFLSKTRNSRDRKPWIFLLVAVVVFFIIQIFKVLEITGNINLGSYSFYLDSMFIAIILFTFIFQYNLILSSELIQIKRISDSYNVKNVNSELDIVERIEKKLKSKEKAAVAKNKTSKLKVKNFSIKNKK